MNTNEVKNDRSGKQISTVTILVALGVAVALCVALYFIGLQQGRAQLADQQARYEQQAASVQSELQAIRSRLDSARNHSRLMEARVALYRTTLDLDQRNFGIANERLQQASHALDQITNASGGLDMKQLSALRTDISGTNVQVATNLEEQRSAILDFATRLDAMAAAAGEAAK